MSGLPAPRFGAMIFSARYEGQTDADVLTRAVAAAEAAEVAGFDDVWVTEHHFGDFGVNPSALTLAAFLLGRTGELPWPVRTVARLCPPVRRPGDPVTADWSNQYTIALCTYRIGPNFVLLRDRRPNGQKIRATLDESWITAFQALTAASERKGEQASQLLDELASAGLALVFEDEQHIVLPTRLNRWPVPYNVV